MRQACLFVIDELSMVGRQMLGKIEFKVRDTLGREELGGLPPSATLGGRDAVLAGDPKQGAPIGGDPLFRMGAYRHRGQNKPRGADRTPGDAGTMLHLAAMGMEVGNSFEDACYLLKVHRYAEEREGVLRGLQARRRQAPGCPAAAGHCCSRPRRAAEPRYASTERWTAGPRRCSWTAARTL